jgi:hypothetical protein
LRVAGADTTFHVKLNENGSASVSFTVDPEILVRMKRKANGMGLGKYMWENILYRAMIDNCF